MGNILKCENLNKILSKKKILDNVSLEINEGDILGFIGPNGAGKTTTIKLILGLQKITSGKVSINGFDIEKDFVKAIERVGTIVENPDMYMYLSGYENLKLVARMYKNVNKQRIEEVIKLVGLENRVKDKVSKYSLGMRQRLGIAQAIIHRPNLLILDEPTNGLDPEGIKELRELLIKLAKEEKMGILISSHNLAELESFCTKICIIKNGKVVETAELEKVKKEATEGKYIIELDENVSLDDLVENEKIDNTKVRVLTTKEEIPNIIEKLVKNKIKIYAVYQEEQSLEDIFLKKTGGNVID